jgi:hypothetical protein
MCHIKGTKIEEDQPLTRFVSWLRSYALLYSRFSWLRIFSFKSWNLIPLATSLVFDDSTKEEGEKSMLWSIQTFAFISQLPEHGTLLPLTTSQLRVLVTRLRLGLHHLFLDPLLRIVRRRLAFDSPAAPRGLERNPSFKRKTIERSRTWTVSRLQQRGLLLS